MSNRNGCRLLGLPWEIKAQILEEVLDIRAEFIFKSRRHYGDWMAQIISDAAFDNDGDFIDTTVDEEERNDQDDPQKWIKPYLRCTGIDSAEGFCGMICGLDFKFTPVPSFMLEIGNKQFLSEVKEIYKRQTAIYKRQIRANIVSNNKYPWTRRFCENPSEQVLELCRRGRFVMGGYSEDTMKTLLRLPASVRDSIEWLYLTRCNIDLDLLDIEPTECLAYSMDPYTFSPLIKLIHAKVPHLHTLSIYATDGNEKETSIWEEGYEASDDEDENKADFILDDGFHLLNAGKIKKLELIYDDDIWGLPDGWIRDSFKLDDDAFDVEQYRIHELDHRGAYFDTSGQIEEVFVVMVELAG